MFEEFVGKEVMIRVAFSTLNVNGGAVPKEYTATILASDLEKTTINVDGSTIENSIFSKPRGNEKMIINNKYIIYVSEKI